MKQIGYIVGWTLVFGVWLGGVCASNSYAKSAVFLAGDATFLKSAIHKQVHSILKRRGYLVLSENNGADPLVVQVAPNGRVWVKTSLLRHRFVIPERYKTSKIRARAIVLFIELFRGMLRRKRQQMEARQPPKRRAFARTRRKPPTYRSMLSAIPERRVPPRRAVPRRNVVPRRAVRSRALPRRTPARKAPRRRAVVPRRAPVRRVPVVRRVAPTRRIPPIRRAVPVRTRAPVRRPLPARRPPPVRRAPLVRRVVPVRPRPVRRVPVRVARRLPPPRRVVPRRSVPARRVVLRVPPRRRTVALGGGVVRRLPPRPLPPGSRRGWFGIELAAGANLGLGDGVTRGAGDQISSNILTSSQFSGRLSFIGGPIWQEWPWLTFRLEGTFGIAPVSRSATPTFLLRPVALVGVMLPTPTSHLRIHLELGGFAEVFFVNGAARNNGTTQATTLFRGGVKFTPRFDLPRVLGSSRFHLFVAPSLYFSPFRAPILEQGQVVFQADFWQLDLVLGVRWKAY
ncbi:MAG: hypothetical protein EP343_32210 [Deltaproteobacteria bacterium]|nr:MAG: hypothetical protein EP343_32210 [Deltaproteobacteria bacterium]